MRRVGVAIKFQVAGDDDVFCAEESQAAGVGAGLGGDGGKAPDGFARQRGDAGVTAGVGASHSGVGEKDFGAGIVRRGEEVRPVFGLHHDGEDGADAADERRDGGGEVQRTGGDDGGISEAVAEELSPGGGGVGEDEVVVRAAGLEFADECFGGGGFADGDGVEPDSGTGRVRGRDGGEFNFPEIFPEGD